ncbi:MAG: MaoC/PaaZ C-terminal domain-containing protein, partial [Candidatus Thorarchaeota archaeon]
SVAFSPDGHILIWVMEIAKERNRELILISEEKLKLNREYIGKQYNSGPLLVDEESIRRYALATNERNLLYTDKGRSEELIAPPIYPVVFIPMLLEQLVDEGEAIGLDILRVVHAEQEMSWMSVIRPGDEIHSSAKIVGMKKLGVHELLELEILCKRQDELVVEMQYRLMLRGNKAREKKGETATTPEKGKKIAEQTVFVTKDQGVRYAEASGDHNPIHTSDEVAKLAGLPKSILQGLCTMAIASQAIVDELLQGNPSRLKAMKVRFSKPVFMAQELTTDVYEAKSDEKKKHVVHFETRDSKGVVVLTRGIAEFV